MRIVVRIGALILALAMGFPASRAPALGQVPDDHFHVSLTLGGYLLLGVGYTHWVEEHHALEFTAFPFAHPGEGFPFAVRAGYAWVPSDEAWRAKLGGNFTLLFHPRGQAGNRMTPLFALTPGIQYDPESNLSLRGDLWISYYLREKVLAPTAVEFLYGFGK